MTRPTCPRCGAPAWPYYDTHTGRKLTGLVCSRDCGNDRHRPGKEHAQRVHTLPGMRAPRHGRDEWRALLRGEDRGSDLELEMLARLRAAQCDPEAREYQFAAPRRWRFDFAWPSIRLAVEVQGGVWSGGRHVRPAGFSAECERRNAAALAGWCVLEYTADAIHSGRAAQEVAAVVASRAGQAERADAKPNVRGPR